MRDRATTLNLDAKEIAAFRALKPAGGRAPCQYEQVEALVRQALLARYQAYRKRDFQASHPTSVAAGISCEAGDELLLSHEQMTGPGQTSPGLS